MADLDPPSGASTSLLPIMPSPPPAAMPSDPHDPALQSIPSLFQKNVFLDWHSKFAFSRPITLGSKQILPTIQLPALAGRSDDIPTAALSQERQSLLTQEEEKKALEGSEVSSNKEMEEQQPSGPIEETPHMEMWEPHSGYFQLGKSLYTPPKTSDSVLNRPRMPEVRSAPPTQSKQNMQLYDADEEEEGLVYFGNENLQSSILSGELDAHTLYQQAQHEEENGLHILAPLVRNAVLKGSYDVVVQLMQRNIDCVDVAIQVAEENGKFALVKYLGMYKEHIRRYGNPINQGGYKPSPNPGSSGLSVPMVPRRPKSVDNDDAFSQKSGKGPTMKSTAQEDNDLVLGDDDSEEVWKLRAIYLLMLMIVLSESTSTEGMGWDSVSTASSSRQSSQPPVDGGEHGQHSGGGGRITLPPGGGRRMGSDNNRKKKRDDDDSEESEGNKRQNPRQRRPSNLRSLGRRYACPFAKSHPDNHVTCWTINRQNLAGVKEHLKRFHFGGTLPSDIRAARTWDDVFDCVAPDWGNKPRPSPYVDMLDIFQRSVRPPPTAPPLAPSGAVFQGWPALQPHPPALSPQPIVPPPHVQRPRITQGFTRQPQVQPQERQFQQQVSPPYLGVSSPSSVGEPIQTGAVQVDLSGDLTQEGLLNPFYASPLSHTTLFADPLQQAQAGFPGAARAISPASALGADFQSDPLGFPPSTGPTSFGNLSFPPSTQAIDMNSFVGLSNSIGMPNFFNDIAGPEIAGMPRDALGERYHDAQIYYHDVYGIKSGAGNPAGDAFSDLMDQMESPAPVSQLAPVYESTSPEPASAMSTNTIRGFFPQPQRAQTGVSTSSSGTRSNSVPSVGYPSSSTSTSLGIHNTAAAISPPSNPTNYYHTPPSNPSTTTPIHISHASSSSSPPSTTISSKEKKYQLLVSRREALPFSTELPGPRVFGFDSFEEFLRNFEGFMGAEFTDPGFNWEEWELANGVTGARLGGVQAVIKDLDFTFLAHGSVRAGLYLVGKEGRGG